MDPGYSGKPLESKLGLRAGMKAVILKEEEDVKSLESQYDLVQFYCKEISVLNKHFDRLKNSIKKNGMLWISWPKKTSGVESDLDENIIRELALKNELVDVKVIAIDEVWSGLKLVYRLKNR